jgi:hypothetical protein
VSKGAIKKTDDIKAHPWGVVGSISETKDVFVTVRNRRLDQSYRGISTTLLDIS